MHSINFLLVCNENATNVNETQSLLIFKFSNNPNHIHRKEGRRGLPEVAAAVGGGGGVSRDGVVG